MRTLAVLLLLGAISLLGAATPAGPRLAWQLDVGGEFVGSPAVAGHDLVIAGKGGRLMKVSMEGKVLWQREYPSPFFAPPVLDAGGTIYVAALDGTVRRVSATGEPLWEVRLDGEVRAAPLLDETALYCVTGQGRIFRIDRARGTLLGQGDLKVPVFSSPIWDERQHHLLLLVKDFWLLAVDRQLQVTWRFRTAGVNFSVPAVTPAGAIYVTSMDHHLYKLAADGRLLWKFKSGAWIMASPVIDERGRVYFGSYDKFFYAVDAGGKSLWRFEGRASFSATAVIDAAGNVYCGDQSGTVFALDGRGRLRWQYKAEDFITSGLTILPGRNLLVVGSIDGKLLAFHCDRPLSRRAWWAKYLGDLRNSGRDE